MANLENNNSENNKPISEKVGEKITDVAEGVKHTIEHPVEAAKETVAQAVEDVQKFSWWAKLFLWFAAIASFLFLISYQDSRLGCLWKCIIYWYYSQWRRQQKRYCL